MEEEQIIKFSSLSKLALAEDVEELMVAGEVNENECAQSSFSIDSSKVTVELSPTTHSKGSSIMVTSSITNYSWELTYRPGTQVAVHSSGNFIAYAIFCQGKGIVRLVGKTGVRSTIKNIPGMIQDLAFSFLNHRILLAFVNEFGTLFVYEVIEVDSEIRTNLLLELKLIESEEITEYQRVLWCPYLPEDLSCDSNEMNEDSLDNLAYLLVAINGCSAEICHVYALVDTFGTGLLDRSDLKPGFGHQMVTDQHSAPISDAAFSPDGTAMATASLDGYVKFFEINITESISSPKCLHKWKPHDGKPLSCIFFLDNYKNPLPNVNFWKYTVTGACNNSELKIWSCQTWKCNQMINFKMNKDHPDFGELQLKAAMDLTSKYLVLSDIKRKVLYVLILSQDNLLSEDSISNGNQNQSLSESSSVNTARVISISEIPVQSPVIYLAIKSAEWGYYKRWKYILHPDDIVNQDEEEENDSDILEGFIIRSVFITEKSLHYATTRYRPSIPNQSKFNESSVLNNLNRDLNSSHESSVFKDGLTDICINLSSSRSEMDSSSVLPQLNALLPPETESGASVAQIDTENQEIGLGKAGTSAPMPQTSTPGSFLVSGACSSTAPEDPVVNPNVMEHNDPGHGPPMALLLLTPESFSSPNRPEDETDMTKDTELRSSSSPSEDLKSAAMSFLMRVNSGSSIPHSAEGGNKNPDQPVVATSGDLEGGPPTDILSSAVSGSSRSSPVDALPPVRSIEDFEEAPLATSEFAPGVTRGTKTPCLPEEGGTKEPSPPTGPAAFASSTSSPSLEVQQILLTQNDSVQNLVNGYADNSSAKNYVKSSSHVTQPPSETDPILKILSMKGPHSSTNDGLNSLMKPSGPPSVVAKCSVNTSVHNTSEVLSQQTAVKPGLVKMEDSSADFSSIQLTCEDLEAEIKSCSSTQRSKVDMPKSIDQGSVARNSMVDEFNSLRQLILSCHNEQLQRSKENLEKNLALKNQLEKFTKNVNQMQKGMEDIKKSQSKVLNQIPHVLSSATKSAIEAIFKKEIHNILVPALENCVESVRSQVTSDCHSMVLNTEARLTDSLAKTVNSKNVVDKISSSVAANLAVHVQGACRDSYNKVVVPGFNAITQEVFSQLSEAFTAGTKEYMTHMEGECLTTRKALQDSMSSSSCSLESAAASLSSHATTLIEALQKNLSHQNSSSTESIRDLRQAVKEEVMKALQDHHAIIEARASRTSTPASSAHTPSNPPLVTRKQLQQLISQGQINSAFKQALSAADLSLVMFVCERLNPQQLFGPPCPLTQDVLLSLINQLSHDLTSFTDLKTKYLEEAVMNLDTNHPVTREHMHQVLQGLQRTLKSYIESNPNHNKLKMLLLAVTHLVTARD